MSALITELNRVLAPRFNLSGRITRIEGSKYYVALPKGVVVCGNATSTAFNIGDVVRVSDRTITGGVISESSLPVFQV